MNNKHSEIMINSLLEENRKLKAMLHKHNFDQQILEEKINIIRFIFTIFESCKNLSTSSLVLFGPFLENLIFKKSINKTDLKFYFNITNIKPTQIGYNMLNENTLFTKFFNIIDNLDFFILKKYDYINKIWIYNVIKNNIIFNIYFYNKFQEKQYFNIQNIELDSVYGLKIKQLTEQNKNEYITNNIIGLLDIFKSNYTNIISPISKSFQQADLFDLIHYHEIFTNMGFNIKNGLKIITMSEQCSICYNNNIKGVFLQCQHIFCLHCIKNHLKSSHSYEKTCPLCRQDLNIIFE